MGSKVKHAPGTFCWTELATRNLAAATEFYTGLFGWKANVKDIGHMNYVEWLIGEEPAGGMLEMDANFPAEVPAHWMTYITVADCDASAAKAVEGGGKVVFPALDIPTVGRFAGIADPTGATFSIIKLAQA